MWYQWHSISDFKQWHDTICIVLGIPHPNQNAKTGYTDTSAQWTTSYTEPVIVATDDIRAIVKSDDAELAVGIGQPCEPPPAPDFGPSDTPYPADGEFYTWDEDSQSWISV